MRAFSILLAAAALVLAVSAATAATAPEAAAGPKVKPWIAVTGSWGMYAMDDVNQDIDLLNAEIAGSGLSMGTVDNGFGIGAAFGMDLNPQFSIGAGFERLSAASSVGDASATIDFKVPAITFFGFGEYRLPMEGPMKVRLGAAGGLVSTSGSLEVVVPGAGSSSTDISGSGPLFSVYGAGDWWASPQFALTASLGYRSANVSETKWGTVNNANYSVDYSGMVLRGGIKFMLTK
jgi:hypothetical protein